MKGRYRLDKEYFYLKHKIKAVTPEGLDKKRNFKAEFKVI